MLVLYETNAIAKNTFFYFYHQEIFLEFFAFSIILIFIILMVFNSKRNFNSAKLPNILFIFLLAINYCLFFQSIFLFFLSREITSVDRIANDLEESKKYSFEIENKNEKKLNLYELDL